MMVMDMYSGYSGYLLPFWKALWRSINALISFLSATNASKHWGHTSFPSGSPPHSKHFESSTLCLENMPLNKYFLCNKEVHQNPWNILLKNPCAQYKKRTLSLNNMRSKAHIIHPVIETGKLCYTDQRKKRPLLFIKQRIRALFQHLYNQEKMTWYRLEFYPEKGVERVKEYEAANQPYFILTIHNQNPEEENVK